MAWSLPSLVFFRALQGLGAGALQPTEQAILRQTFPPEEQGMAMALFSMAVMVGPAIGPTLGGYIVDNFHWSWIFFINVPVGLLGLFMVTRFVARGRGRCKATARVEAEKQRRQHGLARASRCCGSASSALQYVLEEGRADDWFESAAIVALHPGRGLRRWRCSSSASSPRSRRRSTCGCSTTARSPRAPWSTRLMFAMLMASMFLLPLFMQELLGFTATQSGLALMPRTLVMMVAMPIVGPALQPLPADGALAARARCSPRWAQWMLSSANLDSGDAHVVARDHAAGRRASRMILVPLSTRMLASVPRHRLAGRHRAVVAAAPDRRLHRAGGVRHAALALRRDRDAKT